MLIGSLHAYIDGPNSFRFLLRDCCKALCTNNKQVSHSCQYKTTAFNFSISHIIYRLICFHMNSNENNVLNPNTNFSSISSNVTDRKVLKYNPFVRVCYKRLPEIVRVSVLEWCWRTFSRSNHKRKEERNRIKITFELM